jgi:hypothetical protein
MRERETQKLASTYGLPKPVLEEEDGGPDGDCGMRSGSLAPAAGATAFAIGADIGSLIRAGAAGAATGAPTGALAAGATNSCAPTVLLSEVDAPPTATAAIAGADGAPWTAAPHIAPSDGGTALTTSAARGADAATGAAAEAAARGSILGIGDDGGCHAGAAIEEGIVAPP